MSHAALKVMPLGADGGAWWAPTPSCMYLPASGRWATVGRASGAAARSLQSQRISHNLKPVVCAACLCGCGCRWSEQVDWRIGAAMGDSSHVYSNANLSCLLLACSCWTLRACRLDWTGRQGVRRQAGGRTPSSAAKSCSAASSPTAPLPRAITQTPPRPRVHQIVPARHHRHSHCAHIGIGAVCERRASRQWPSSRAPALFAARGLEAAAHAPAAGS
jgi:hypothetical protein